MPLVIAQPTPPDPDLFTLNDISFVDGFGVSTSPFGLDFKTDGTKMYIGDVGLDSIREYNLSVAWDVSTGSFIQQEVLGFNPYSVRFRPDGLKMYVVDGNGLVYEYDISPAWDVTTSSFVQNKDLGPTSSGATSVTFNPTGTKLYTLAGSHDRVDEYNMTVAWDISTASLFQSQSISAQETTPYSVEIVNEGTKMFVNRSINPNDVHEYTLSTAYDITSASFVQTKFLSEGSSYYGLRFSDTGHKLFTASNGLNQVLEYNLT